MANTMDINDIMKLLPHRYPFLLVDRILDYTEDTITGIKNVTINEPFFQGHFPGHPIMPGVLIVEGMAQCIGCLMMRNVENPGDYVMYFMGLNNVKFRKPVLPGDTLIYKMQSLRSDGRAVKIKGEAYVEDKKVCEAEMTAMRVPRSKAASEG